MSNVQKDLDDNIIGKRALIERCEANIHDNNEGCVCRLIGRIVRIERRENTGIPHSYKIKGRNKYVRGMEVARVSESDQ